MKKDQKFTPKYWVGHSKTSSDVFLETAEKSKEDSEITMGNLFGDNWEEKYEVILIEIKIVLDVV